MPMIIDIIPRVTCTTGVPLKISVKPALIGETVRIRPAANRSKELIVVIFIFISSSFFLPKHFSGCA